MQFCSLLYSYIRRELVLYVIALPRTVVRTMLCCFGFWFWSYDATTNDPCPHSQTGDRGMTMQIRTNFYVQQTLPYRRCVAYKLYVSGTIVIFYDQCPVSEILSSLSPSPRDTTTNAKKSSRWRSKIPLISSISPQLLTLTGKRYSQPLYCNCCYVRVSSYNEFRQQQPVLLPIGHRAFFSHHHAAAALVVQFAR